MRPVATTVEMVVFPVTDMTDAVGVRLVAEATVAYELPPAPPPIATHVPGEPENGASIK